MTNSTLTIHQPDLTMPEATIEKFGSFVTLTVSIGDTKLEVFYNSYGVEPKVTVDEIAEMLKAHTPTAQVRDHREAQKVAV